jgi:ATP-dependent Clp protease ATP-binding subunit ClpA
MNRLDKVVTLKPLRPDQLGQVLEIELKMVEQRINASPERSFHFELTGGAKELLLRQGPTSSTARGRSNAPSSDCWSSRFAV